MRRGAGGRLTLWLVSSGASILEGDELCVSLRLRAGAHLAVRSVAAQLAHPCPEGGWGALTVEAEVGGGSRLRWAPEPVIVAAGAGYRATTEIDVATGTGATLRWTEELVLGRTGEDPAAVRLDTATSIDADGRPRWRDGLTSGPGWLGPAVLDGARYVAGTVDLGAPPHGAAHPAATAPPGGGPAPWLPLAGGGRSLRTLDRDPARGRGRHAAGAAPGPLIHAPAGAAAALPHPPRVWLAPGERGGEEPVKVPCPR